MDTNKPHSEKTLGELGLGGLMRRAISVGVDEAEWVPAGDAEDKAKLIALIQAKLQNKGLDGGGYKKRRKLKRNPSNKRRSSKKRKSTRKKTNKKKTNKKKTNKKKTRRRRR